MILWGLSSGELVLIGIALLELVVFGAAIAVMESIKPEDP